ncbi:NAD(P)-binding protein [Gonapodya prolifera JEL478]|uniref:NAD(P)-binding protein n=1 Tax=Gonapodya prolifera (strain JEL478) TaxID=1344416 RepID=A0A139A2G2_GONPJ|nr:NAD(P)-binding protein [Gonapodya prolifera JEL478]|eukprot:KXS10952.1 NAD(P)-binding protein [Gonapodya prolifera JEL478]
MSSSLQGKVCIVTGGAEGIGRAIGERLLSMGARVMIGDIQQEAAEKFINEYHKTQSTAEVSAIFQKTDITSVDDCRQLIKATVDRFGKFDVLVANAGFSGDPFLQEVDSDIDVSWMRGMQGNLIGTMLLSRLALAHWTRNNIRGAIVITSSIAGYFPSIGHPCMSYAVSKAAQMANLHFVLEKAAKEKGLTESPIRCNAIMPGAVWTGIWHKGRHAASNFKDPEDFLSRNPFGNDYFDKMNGGWTPMNKLVDAYIKCIEDESIRGSCFIVNGAAGEMRLYPEEGSTEVGGSLEWEKYVSREKRDPENWAGSVAK